MPGYICSKCEYELTNAFTFKLLCEKTDLTLREMAMSHYKMEEMNKTNVISDYFNDVDCFDSEENDEKHENSLICSICSKLLPTQRGYKLHMLKHNKEKIHKCHICLTKFTKADLFKHLQTSHKYDTDSQTFTCQNCDVTFTTPDHLTKHLQEHAEDGQDFQGENGVSIKVENSDGNNEHDDSIYGCSYCGRVLSSYRGLKIHMRKHTGEVKCKVSISGSSS